MLGLLLVGPGIWEGGSNTVTHQTASLAEGGAGGQSKEELQGL